MHPEQKKALKAMTPADKFRLLGRMWQSAWDLKTAYIRQTHPDWDDARVKQTVRDIFLYARR